MFDPISLSAIEGLYDVIDGLRAGFTNGMKIYNTAGAFNFIVPANVSKVKAIIIGGGGGGAMGRLPLGADVSAYKAYLATKFFNGEDGLSSSFGSLTAAGGPGGKQNGVSVGVDGGVASNLFNGGSLVNSSVDLEKLNQLVEPNSVLLKTKLGVCDMIPNVTQTGSYNMSFNNAPIFNSGLPRQDIGPLVMTLPLVSGEMVAGNRGDGFGAGGAGGASVALNSFIDHSVRFNPTGTTVTYAHRLTEQLPEMKYASSVPFNTNMSLDATDPMTTYAGELSYTKKPTIKLIGSGGGTGEVKTGILDVTAGATISGNIGRGGRGGKYLKFNPLLSCPAAGPSYYHTKFIEIFGQTAGNNVVGIDTMLTTWRSSAGSATSFIAENDWWNGTKVFETPVGSNTPNIDTTTSAVSFNKPMTLAESVGRDGVVIIMW